MMKIRNVIRVGIALAPTLVGIVLLIKDLKLQAAHPEWSASPFVVWIKFSLFLIVSIGLAIFLFKSKNN